MQMTVTGMRDKARPATRGPDLLLLGPGFPHDAAGFDGVAFEAKVGQLLLNRMHRFVFVDVGRDRKPLFQLVLLLLC